MCHLIVRTLDYLTSLLFWYLLLSLWDSGLWSSRISEWFPSNGFRSAVFANVVNVNSTASNATVPSGLWAIPSLGDLPLIGNIPNMSLGAGRRRRSVGDNMLGVTGDILEMEEDLKPFLRGLREENIRGDVRPGENVFQQRKNLKTQIHNIFTTKKYMKFFRVPWICPDFWKVKFLFRFFLYK